MDVAIGWKPFTCEFQGQQVALRVRPLRRAAALRVLPYLKKATEAQGDTYKLVADTVEMQALVPEIFPEHVRDIDLTVDGRAATMEDLAEEAVLGGLVGSIFAHLIRISFFSRADEKNSDGPSGG